jgi:DNA-binding NtrC family response regulator
MTLEATSSFYVPVAPVSATPVRIADIITIGVKAAALRPIQRVFRGSGWSVAHVDSLDAALRYLRSNVAAVAITETEVGDESWKDVVSQLRKLPDAPEIVVLACDRLCVNEAVGTGAYDVLRRPIEDADLLWTVATAWHDWMKQREREAGGELCSSA